MSVDNPVLISSSSQTRSRIIIVLCWAIVLGMLAVVVYGNIRSSAAADAQDVLNIERERMFGMLVVQMKALQKDGSTALIGNRMGQLIEQAEEEARTPEDRVRIAILAGEALGADAALQRLSQIDESGKVGDDVRSIQTIYENGADALSEPEKENLIRRHGYLGRLALAHDVPADQEPRKSLQTEALWFTVRLSVLGAGVLALGGLSLLLFAVGAVWFYQRKIQPAYVPNVPVRTAFLESFALYLILFLVLSLLLRLIGPFGLQWTWVALVILPAVWLWLMFRGTTTEERLKALGWHRGRGFFREVAAGLAGYIAGLVVIAVGCLISYLLIRYSGARAASPIVRELTGGPLQLVGVYALACIFAPVMEESMFRGLLFSHMRQRWGWAFSAFVVSLIFALLHPQGWVAAPALLSIAMVLAALREWRGSLIAPMAAHACNNFLVLTAALILIR